MYLSQIKIHSLRNIQEANLHLNPRFNVFYGFNGSGKTSLLESVYVLTTGKSFRTSHADELIQFKALSYAVAGFTKHFEHDASLRMGIERKRAGGFKIHVNDEPCHSMAELAKLLPVQLLNTDSYRLLETSPEYRRQFLDWGVFHVEHLFFQTWQRYKRALQQRNAALKNKQQRENKHQVHIWDPELTEAGEAIDELRKAYLASWMPTFSEIVREFLDIGQVTVQYHRGWAENVGLQTTLQEGASRDMLLGYTTRGPHRADLSFWIKGIPAKTVLSRGQLKLFVCALFLARSRVLHQRTNKACVFLVDDLSSELDTKASQLLMEGLERLEGQGQVIITVIEKNSIARLLEGKECKMFHVEQGVVKEDDSARGRVCTA